MNDEQQQSEQPTPEVNIEGHAPTVTQTQEPAATDPALNEAPKDAA